MAAVGPTRRDFVAMLLGAPLAPRAAARARRGSRPASLVETGDDARGHAAIRDARRLPAAPAPRVARAPASSIVGAGVAGLAAAWELRRRGITDVVGARARRRRPAAPRAAARSAVTPYPWGAHYIVAPQQDQADLIALLERARRDRGLRRRWHAGRSTRRCAAASPRSACSTAAAGTRASTSTPARAPRIAGSSRRSTPRSIAWSAWRDAGGRRAFAIPVSRRERLRRGHARSTSISFAAWLDARGFTSERLRWLCDYACRDDYALTAADTSAWAGLFYFAARRAAAGATYQSVVTWPDGNGALVRHLATRRARSRPASRSRSVDEDGAVDRDRPGRRRSACARGAVDRRGAGVRREPDRAGPPRRRRARLRRVGGRERPPARAAPRARAARRRRGTTCSATARASATCRATHQRGRDRGPTVWTWYYPFTGEPAPRRASSSPARGYAEWAEVVLADLERAHPDVRALRRSHRGRVLGPRHDPAARRRAVRRERARARPADAAASTSRTRTCRASRCSRRRSITACARRARSPRRS